MRTHSYTSQQFVLNNDVIDTTLWWNTVYKRKKERKKENIFFHQVSEHSCMSNTMSATDIIISRTLFSAQKVFGIVVIAQRKFILIPLFRVTK
jgi:5-keto 4-deoxyuronate isomerase